MIHYNILMSDLTTSAAPLPDIAKVLEQTKPIGLVALPKTPLQIYQEDLSRKVLGNPASSRGYGFGRRQGYWSRRNNIKTVSLLSTKNTKDREMIHNYLHNKRAYATNFIAILSEQNKCKGLHFHNSFTTQLDPKKILAAELSEFHDHPEPESDSDSDSVGSAIEAAAASELGEEEAESEHVNFRTGPQEQSPSKE